MSKSVLSRRATHNALLRYRAADDPLVVEAAMDLKAARAEQYARELIEGWPPLSAEQRCRIAAALLSPVERAVAA